MNDLETLTSQVLSLSKADRAILMDEILASLDSKALDTISRAKRNEIQRRRKAYCEGRIPTVNLEESRKRMGL